MLTPPHTTRTCVLCEEGVNIQYLQQTKHVHCTIVYMSLCALDMCNTSSYQRESVFEVGTSARRVFTSKIATCYLSLHILPLVELQQRKMFTVYPTHKHCNTDTVLCACIYQTLTSTNSSILSPLLPHCCNKEIYVLNCSF